MMRFIFTFLLAYFLVSSDAQAQNNPSQAEPPHAAPTLISPVTGTGSGPTVPVAVHIKLEKGWHTYWRTPGEAGLAPTFDWTGSENIKETAVKWPAPYRFSTSGLDNFGYVDDVTFPIDITLVDSTKPLPLKLKLDIVVCSDICLPETHNLTLDIPNAPASASNNAHSYHAALKKIPTAESLSLQFTSGYLDFDSTNSNYLTLTAKTAVYPSAHTDIFVENSAGLVFGKPSVSYSTPNQEATFRLPAHTEDSFESLVQQMADNALTLTVVDGSTATEHTLKLSPRPEGLPAINPQPALEKVVETLTFAKIALFAFLGGLILNLMPCVLPVLSLKVLSVVSHGGKENRRTIFKNFMASAAGIIFSFWVMAAGLIALKAIGATIGWGIQFQHPAFLVFLIVTVLIFAASMWGTFDIPLPAFVARNIPARHEHEPTLLGHFMTGAFATLLATPCTAPFLGTAIGFALARDAGEIFSVFSMIGLGLAAPYILLSVSPRVFKYMPKPGKWMITLKKILSLALIATAAWLINVLITISTTSTLDHGWQAFDEALIKPAVDDGKTVIVDVTADWCLTCKANKRLVLEQADIIDALSGPEIVRLQADWTHRDETIAAYLRSHGRYGIPFNIVYGPGAPEGIPLPELLSKKAVLNALAQAAGE